jgi:hypothetical protein
MVFDLARNVLTKVPTVTMLVVATTAQKIVADFVFLHQRAGYILYGIK